MRLVCIFFILFFSSESPAISSVDFISGADKNFNKEFIKRFIASAVKNFSTAAEPKGDFKKEVDFFLKHEKEDIFFPGDAAKVKRTKFFLKFLVTPDKIKKTYLILFSNERALHTWDLSDFSKVEANYAPANIRNLESCKLLNKSDTRTFDYLSVNLKTKACRAYVTKETLEHPAYKGFVQILSSGGKLETQTIVKTLLPSFTSVPLKIKIFARNWRLPPSRFINRESENELYIP